jgi:hypothetical protein
MNFDTLPQDYPHFFEHAKEYKPKLKKPRYRYDEAYFMSFDTEYEAVGGKNVVISYQIATASKDRTANIIVHMEHGKRLTLAEIIAKGISSVTDGEGLTR